MHRMHLSNPTPSPWLLRYRETALGLTAALALWGCSSGGFVGGEDLAGHGTDPSRDGGADAGAPMDGSGALDGSFGDLALPLNSWTFFGQLFQGAKPSCLPVDNFWAVTVNATAPYFCSLDVFFAARPTRDAVYPASATPPPGLPADRAQIVITDERTGGVEQWHGIEDGQVAVHVDGSMLTISVQNMVVRGAVSVPPGTPNQPVWGTLRCP